MEPLRTEIYLAADHAGFTLKESIREWLRGEGCTVIDLGALEYDEADDFPPFMVAAGLAVAEEPNTRAAIIFGGSGQGEAMAANRIPGVRATVYYGGPEEIITLSRQHNDANVLSIGARFVDEAAAKAAITTWLTTPFVPGTKYERRNNLIDELLVESE